ncbi:MAG: enoyl-CoA hydratase/carnithine racemase [Acidimicrobiales bacterium]|jgi:enoyl-CoA hydratase/carnithine racemase
MSNLVDVAVESDGAVRVVTLTRPERRNALNPEMLGALQELFTAEPDPAERVTVIRAEGPAFCSGVDLKERQSNGMATSATAIEEMLHSIELYPLPVVAVVQGDAIAGGNELALHCDIVVASSQARFGMSLAQIGLAPSWFLAKRLLEVGGPVFARRMLLLGDPLPSTRLAELGLIHEAVDPSELDAAAAAVIDRLAANAPLSLKAMKGVLTRQMTFRDGLEHADVDALVETARQSSDAKEGIAALLERRKPTFTSE